LNILSAVADAFSVHLFEAAVLNRIVWSPICLPKLMPFSNKDRKFKKANKLPVLDLQLQAELREVSWHIDELYNKPTKTKLNWSQRVQVG